MMNSELHYQEIISQKRLLKHYSVIALKYIKVDYNNYQMEHNPIQTIKLDLREFHFDIHKKYLKLNLIIIF